MTVLVEGLSVIIKLETIDEVIPDGFEGFRQYIPNFEWCKDDKIIRLGFFTMDEADEFIKKMESLGLVFKEQESAKDFALVDQIYGISSKCEWLEYGHVNLHNDPQQTVAACRYVGSEDANIVTPVDWKYEGSLTAVHGLTPKQQG